MDSGFRFDLFVYGTLKVGYRNHGRYCYGNERVEEASVPGCLYECMVYQYRYPSLVIPEALILQRGSGDYARDLELSRKWNTSRLASSGYIKGRHWSEVMASISHESNVSQTDSAFRVIHGEFMSFNDPSVGRVIRLDELETFKPYRLEQCEYLRVLVPVRLSDGAFMAAWMYIDATDQEDLLDYPYASWPEND